MGYIKEKSLGLSSLIYNNNNNMNNKSNKQEPYLEFWRKMIISIAAMSVGIVIKSYMYYCQYIRMATVRTMESGAPLCGKFLTVWFGANNLTC